MPKKTTKIAKPLPKVVTPQDDAASEDVGRGLMAVATAIDSVADNMPKSWDLDRFYDCVAELGHLGGIADALAARTIAEYGDETDRAKALAYLKRRLGDDFRD